MGSFNALLAGLATKAGSNFKDLADEKRKQQERENDLTASAIEKELQTNDSLDQQSHEALSRQLYKLRGVPNSVADQLIQAHNHLWDNYNASQKSKQSAKDAVTQSYPNLQGPDQVSAPTPTDLGSMPGQALPPTASLPNIPPPPFDPGTPSIGDVKFANTEPRAVQAEQDKYTALRDAQRKMTKGEFQDKLDLLKQIDSDPTLSDAEKDERRRIVGALPKTAGSIGTLSKPVTGEDMKALLGSDTFPDGRLIDPNKEYIAVKVGNKITDGHEYVQPTTGRATVPDPESPTGWSLVQVDRTGQVLGKTAGMAPPPQYAPMVRNGQRQEWVDFGDHKELKTLNYGATSQRLPQAGMPGAPASAAPAPSPAPPSGGAPGAPAPPAPGAPIARTPATAQVSTRPMPGPPVPRQQPGGTLASETKGLSPKSKMDVVVGVNATDRAITPMERMLNNLDVLNNPAVAAAIQLQADPNSGKLVTLISGKAIKGNAKAEQFAADVVAATEDINKIRGAFGATAFRGHDAFQAMIAQAGAGRLLADPGVLRNILTKSIGDLQTMRDEQAQFVGIAPKYTVGGSLPQGGPAQTPAPTKSLDEIFKKK